MSLAANLKMSFTKEQIGLVGTQIAIHSTVIIVSYHFVVHIYVCVNYFPMHTIGSLKRLIQFSHTLIQQMLHCGIIYVNDSGNI